MSFKEVTILRKEGKLDEALSMAHRDLQTDPDNIWNKRSIGWVYYSFLQLNALPEKYDIFLEYLNKLGSLQLPSEEKMILDYSASQISKLVFSINRQQNVEHLKIDTIFDTIKDIPFPRPSVSYSFLYKAFHKGHECWNRYLEFADWWDFKNFRPEDYQKEEFKGKQIMSVVEQAYLAYAKKLIDYQEDMTIENIFYKDVPFTTQLLSLYYPFTETEIEKYWDILIPGDPYYSEYVYDLETLHESEVGLCYNENILWTDSLMNRWQLGSSNPFIASLQGYKSFDDNCFSNVTFPLNAVKELETRQELKFQLWSDAVLPYLDPEDTESFNPPSLNINENFKKKYHKLSYNQIEELWKNHKEILLYNESIWKNTLADIFIPEKVFNFLNNKGILQNYKSKKERIEDFLPKLDVIIENHPEFQYPSYSKAKLLLALGEGDQGNLLSAILPFAKTKRNEFWVWDVLSEAFPPNDERHIACLCRAVMCKASEDFLVKVRQKLTATLILESRYNEAKVEIEKIISTRQANGWSIPFQIRGWQDQPWYQQTAADKKSSIQFLKAKAILADKILFADEPEQTIVVEFVNVDKKVLNFITKEKITGYFKYEGKINNPKIGNILHVRIKQKGNEGFYQIITAKKSDIQVPDLVKKFSGILKVNSEKGFGFVEDIFVESRLINDKKIQPNAFISGEAIITYNKKKQDWGWKAFEIR